VLDPIDGTKSFISGVPLFGTLIALLYRGAPILGLLDQPISRERWIGAVGRPSTCNGAPIRTRECAEPAAATLFSTSPDMFQGEDAGRWQRAAKAVKLVRYGADCYAYGLLARGFCDSVIEADLKLYDFAAHIPIIEGAGGRITNWQGAAPGMKGDGRILAAGDARLHARLVELLSG
jgi:inositol-phosphate phosphatase/L-galactose 1-phosphate phosphatase/histidinol-phosphatase